MRLARQIVAQGVGAWERDDFESALKTFVGVLEDFPHFADVRNKAGLCEAMLGRLEKALLHFDAALEENPSYAEAHLNRGIILNELGRHEEAQEAFDEAGQIDTRDSRAFPSDVGNRIAVTHAQLGDLYLAANRSEEAAQRKPLRGSREALRGRDQRAASLHRYSHEVRWNVHRQWRSREGEDGVAGHPRVTPRIRGCAHPARVVLQRTGDTDGAIRERKQCAADDPADMRPLASGGVTFPHVHPGTDGD